MIDLRSDTVTQPTAAMRRAMAEAPVGDDVYGEDPTVNRLELLAAERTGKEAALFVPSGTMANLLAALAHCPRGSSLLVGDLSDLWLWEAGGASVLGGLVYEPITTDARGELPCAAIEAAFDLEDDPQRPRPGLICLENTHCMRGGVPLSFDYLAAVRELAARKDVPVHLDGARLFNAAVAQGVGAEEITAFADSVTFCLSKGLAAPVGSLLAGEERFIDRARRLRKMLGGGMRQAGVIAAAGVVALEEMTARLAEDHHHARLLAAALADVPGLELETSVPATNIVFWRLADEGFAGEGFDVRSFIARLEERGVRVGELGRGRVRAVTHHGVGAGAVEQASAAIRRVLEEMRSGSAGGV